MKLYVGNLYFQTTAKELRQLFSDFGKVVDVTIVTDHYTRQSKGFGYVEMACRRDGISAMSKLQGESLRNRKLDIKEARQRDERLGKGW